MLLKAIIDDQELSLEIPEQILEQGQPFFAKLDADMDQGWQMSREWIARPTQIERCQIVADKLLTALEKENDRLGMLMAGYLLSRLPGLEAVTLDTHGEMQNTLFTVAANPAIAPAALAGPEVPVVRAASGQPVNQTANPSDYPSVAQSNRPATAQPGANQPVAMASAPDTPETGNAPFIPTPAPMGLDKFQALEQAGNDVTPIFKVGKGYRFSVYDHGTGQWLDAPLVATEADAQRLRQAAFKARFESLQQAPG